MDDKIFAVDLERSRIYWDYYKTLFIVLSLAFIALMVCCAIIYPHAGIELVIAVGVLLLMFLFVIFLMALMSLTVWRHENKFLDELILMEQEDIEEKPTGIPIV